MPIGQNQIRPAIQIEIDKARAPARIHHRGHADSRRSGYILKGIVSGIAVQGIAFPVDVRDKKILPPIRIEVDRIHAHARTSRTIRAIRHSSLETNFFKFTASLVQIQEVANGIIRDKQVHQAVVVDVRRDNAKGLPKILPNPRRDAHVGKSSVAVILIETARPWFVGLGIAIMANPVCAAITFQ